MKSHFLTDVEVNGVKARALVDVTVVPARLVPALGYTGVRQWPRGLGRMGSLPKAEVTLSFNGQDTKMNLLQPVGISDFLICPVLYRCCSCLDDQFTDSRVTKA